MSPVSPMFGELNTSSTSQIQIPNVPEDLQIVEDSEVQYLSAVTPLMLDLCKRVRQRVREGGEACRFTLMSEKYGLLTPEEIQEINTLYPGFGPREAVLRYFHRVSAMYVEIPSHRYTRDANVHVPTYTKFITTGNFEIVKSWVDVSTLKKSALSKFDNIDSELGMILPHLKLSRSKTTGEKSIVNARTGFDISDDKTRAIPVILLYVAVREILKQAKNGYVAVTYTKDNRDKKVITTTTNFELLASVYNEDIARDALDNSDIGDFLDLPSIDRGYLRLPSVGESRHADITRSLNVARIVNIEYDAEPDLSNIDIDTTQVLPHFYSSVNKLSRPQLEALGVALREQEMSRFVIEGNVASMEEWVSAESTVGGTSFINRLALFMMANGALWFSGYTGEAVEHSNVQKGNAYGVLDHGLS